MNSGKFLSCLFVIAVIIVLTACTGERPPAGSGSNPPDNGSGTSGTGDGNFSGSTNDPGETITMTDISRGLQVWSSGRCTECHTIGDDPGGNTGPALTGIGDRYTVDELKAWIANPQAVNPAAEMPAQNLSAEDLEYLARYLSTLSSDTAFESD